VDYRRSSLVVEHQLGFQLYNLEHVSLLGFRFIIWKGQGLRWSWKMDSMTFYLLNLGSVLFLSSISPLLSLSFLKKTKIKTRFSIEIVAPVLRGSSFYNIESAILTIFKCTTQWHSLYSPYCITITPVHFQNSSIIPSKTQKPKKLWSGHTSLPSSLHPW
jgi:hypothetical protein